MAAAMNIYEENGQVDDKDEGDASVLRIKCGACFLKTGFPHAVTIQSFRTHIMSISHKRHTRDVHGHNVRNNMPIKGDSDRFVVFCGPKTFRFYESMLDWGGEFGLVTDLWHFTDELGFFIITIGTVLREGKSNRILEESFYGGQPIWVMNRAGLTDMRTDTFKEMCEQVRFWIKTDIARQDRERVAGKYNTTKQYGEKIVSGEITLPIAPLFQ